jgi:hypothetical protein
VIKLVPIDPACRVSAEVKVVTFGTDQRIIEVMELSVQTSGTVVK